MKRPRVHFVNIRSFLFGVVIVCLLGLSAYGQPWSGSGTPNDLYSNDMQVDCHHLVI